jgi:hypothetical protein
MCAPSTTGALTYILTVGHCREEGLQERVCTGVIICFLKQHPHNSSTPTGATTREGGVVHKVHDVKFQGVTPAFNKVLTPGVEV